MTLLFVAINSDGNTHKRIRSGLVSSSFCIKLLFWFAVSDYIVLEYHVFAVHRKVIFPSISPCFSVILSLSLAGCGWGRSLLTFWRLEILSKVRWALRGSDLGRLWAELEREERVYFPWDETGRPVGSACVGWLVCLLVLEERSKFNSNLPDDDYCWTLMAQICPSRYSLESKQFSIAALLYDLLFQLW